MPYITFSEYPAGPAGRQFRNVVLDPDTGMSVGEVDAVLDGETEVTPDTHATAVELAQTAYVTEVASMQSIADAR